MSELRWTTAFLALLAITLILQVSMQNGVMGFSLDTTGLLTRHVVHVVWLAACLAVCLLLLVYRDRWWHYFQGRKIPEGPIDREALARSVLLVLGAWLILDPLLDLLSEVRDWMLTPAGPFDEPLSTHTVDWIRHTTGMVLGGLVSLLSCPIAGWFARTQCTRRTGDDGDARGGEPQA